MAGRETRMLVLGAVALFEPVNGYQIRRELMSWQVDRWANVEPGSIYHGLTTLTRRGHLLRHDVIDGGREVAVYEITPSGRDELDALLAEALETVDLYDEVAFQAAFGMLPLLTRARATSLLAARLHALGDAIADLSAMVREAGAVTPPHAIRMVLLQRARARAERRWLAEVLDDIRAGGFDFAGEAMRWTPADDDPGWQMHADREKYRALLER